MEFKDFDYLNRVIEKTILPKQDMPHLVNHAEEHRQEEKLYWEQTLTLLTDIKQNTANLSTILDLIAKSNNNQEEIIEIIKELLSLATIKDNPEKAQSLYRKTMDKINKMTTDVDTMQKLYGFGLAIYQTLHSLSIM